MKIIKLNFLFILIGLFCSFTANATIVTVDFTATVDRVSFLDLSPPGVSVGALLNGRFTFDTSSDPNFRKGDLKFQIGTFNPSGSSTSIFHDASAGSFGMSGGWGVGRRWVGSYVDQDLPQYFWDSEPTSDIVTVFLEYFSINLSHPLGAVFDIDNLTGFPTSKDTFADATFIAEFYVPEPVGYFASISGTLDSITVSSVPLPASFWLMSTAVIGVFSFFRKQNKLAA